MNTKGRKLLAGILATAVVLTMIPVDKFAATEKDEFTWDMAVGFTAGAHHAMEDTVVLSDTEVDYIATAILNGEAPLVAEAFKEEVVQEEIAQAETVQEETKKTYENIAVAKVEEYVNIRAAADENSESLGKLYVNGVATVLETLEGWYKISSGSVTGYVNAEYLIVGDEAAYLAAGKRLATVTTSDRLNLRREPSKSARVLVALPSGTKATVVDESVEGWIGVIYGNYTGYISADYAVAETIYTYAESKEEEAARLAAAEAARIAEEQARLRKEEAARLAAEERKRREEEIRAAYVPPTGGTGQDVVNYAVQFVGYPYVLGGSSLTGGIDCSNFVMRIYEAFGVSLPHNSYALRSVGYEVSADEMKAGDIICYSGHVSIYMGDGRCVHAANSKDGIKISPKWNYNHVITIRRIFND